MVECPSCKSFDVQVSQQIYDEKLEKIKYSGVNPAKKITYKKDIIINVTFVGVNIVILVIMVILNI